MSSTLNEKWRAKNENDVLKKKNCEELNINNSLISTIWDIVKCKNEKLTSNVIDFKIWDLLMENKIL